MSPEIKVSFNQGNLAERNLLANNLKLFIQDEVNGIDIHLEREQKNTMDMGATVAIILGSASITALAKGIGNWIQKMNASSVVVTIGENSMNVSNVRPSELKPLIEVFLSQYSNEKK